jgi:hypothetical protein
MADKKWSGKPYRGRTSLDIREALGLTNKQAVIATIGIFGGLGLLILLIKRRTY